MTAGRADNESANAPAVPGRLRCVPMFLDAAGPGTAPAASILVGALFQKRSAAQNKKSDGTQCSIAWCVGWPVLLAEHYSFIF